MWIETTCRDETQQIQQIMITQRVGSEKERHNRYFFISNRDANPGIWHKPYNVWSGMTITWRESWTKVARVERRRKTRKEKPHSLKVRHNARGSTFYSGTAGIPTLESNFVRNGSMDSYIHTYCMIGRNKTTTTYIISNYCTCHCNQRDNHSIRSIRKLKMEYRISLIRDIVSLHTSSIGVSHLPRRPPSDQDKPQTDSRVRTFRVSHRPMFGTKHVSVRYRG